MLTAADRFALLPVYVMLNSLAQAAAGRPGCLPLDPVARHFRPFVDIWRTVPLGRYFVNILIVSRRGDRSARW